jgi:Cof subfamily protein (haloacid dehalogenase superfamily)
MKNIALVISDIDGTLITSNHEVTEDTRNTALALRDNGIGLSLASSRPPRAVEPIAAELGLASTYAAFNGAMILTSGGEILAESAIAPAVTARIREIALERGLDVWLYDKFDWWVSVHTPFVEREEHTTGFTALFDDYEAQLSKPLNKLTVVGGPALVAEAERMIHDELGEHVSASRSKPRFLDVTSFGWHKGSVVTRLSKLFATPPAQVAVIGDGPNDVEMFAAAGVSIAMGQAVDEVRKKATYITSSNDDEGWSKGISKYVLNRK